MVPLYRLRRWLSGSDGPADGDLLGEPEPDKARRQSSDPQRPPALPSAVLWRGAERSICLQSLDELRPGDTLVLPLSAGGWDELGHIPGNEDVDGAGIDVAELAFMQARNRPALRLHPALKSRLPSAAVVNELLERAADSNDPPRKSEWRDLLNAAAKSIGDVQPWRRIIEALGDPRTGLVVEPYPNRRGVVLTSRKRLAADGLWSLPALDDGEDQPSRILRDAGVSLPEHTRHVMDKLRDSLTHLPIGPVSPALRLAAALHDTGKADERFQALLRRADRTEAWLHAGASRALLAKSGALPLSPHERDAARRRAGLPARFRHEMLSVQLAEQWPGLSNFADHRNLALHLVAAHHGHARPFAPVVADPEPPDVESEIPAVDLTAQATNGEPLVITADQRRSHPPHRLDSGVAERFWSLTRRFGWWGLAYLEAVLRLADQQASAAEEVGRYDASDQTKPAEVTA